MARTLVIYVAQWTLPLTPMTLKTARSPKEIDCSPRRFGNMGQAPVPHLLFAAFQGCQDSWPCISLGCTGSGDADNPSHSLLSTCYVGATHLMHFIHGNLPTVMWTSMTQMGKQKHEPLRTSLEQVCMGGFALGSATLWSWPCGGGEGAGACCYWGRAGLLVESHTDPTQSSPAK